MHNCAMNTPTCLACNGYGYVYVTDDVRDSRFGRASPCPQCRGGERGERLRRLGAICRIPPRYANARLTNFSDVVRHRVEHALVRSRSEQTFLTVWGGVGVGKTHLLSALVHEGVQRGLLSVFATWPELIQHLRELQRHHVSSDDFWSTLLQADVLALDEVDKSSGTDWVGERLFALLNTRYNQSKGLTALASNHALERGRGFFGETFGPLESRLLAVGNVTLSLGFQDRRLA